ncbi:MAG: alpha/beta hydrolase family protein [Segniliparus sp.]|uniref:alpha/beta hydrolase family protein n=1 Tax=Segniliparus sp. TaxID=2804064 RepID=UPI003F2C9017
MASAAPLAIVASGVLTACEESKPASPPPRPAPPVTATTTTTPLASLPPGTKLPADAAAAAWKGLLPPGADATLIRYRSTSGIDGSATDVGAVVLTPAGPAPEGGWPIVTVGHGLTGTAAGCGPAEHPELASISARIVPLVKAGYLVVMSDYQGLSGSGTHPFLDPKTAAYNLIDAVAAARQLVPQHSNKWAALGHSQGGQAAWAALEHAKEYGKSFQFVGAVALAPAVQDTEFLDAALAGQLSKGQESVFPALIAGYLAKHPEGKWEDFLSGALLDNHEAFTSCAPENLGRRAELTAQIAPSDAVPATPEAQAKLRSWLEEIELPKTAGDGPLLVVQGANDELVRPEWVKEAVQQGCKLGLRVQEIVRPGQGHGVEDDKDVLDWLAARFAGDQQAPSSCE